MCVVFSSFLNKVCMLWLCCDVIDVFIYIGILCVRVSCLICMGFDYLVVGFSSIFYREMFFCDPDVLVDRYVFFLVDVSVFFGEMLRDVMEFL